MNLKIIGEAIPVRIPSSVYLDAVEFLPALNRNVRMDSPATQGVSTEWFTRSAFLDGDYESAHAYADLERAEWLVVDALFEQWLADLFAFLDRHLPHEVGRPQARRVPAQVLWVTLRDQGQQALAALHRAIDSQRDDGFDIAQTALRHVHIASNDLYVEWIQDLLTLAAEALGDNAVEEATRVTYESTWKQRYEAWFELSGPERVALTCGGMRAHYGGQGRRGDFQVEEFPDRYVLTFDPCGSGGVLRRTAANGSTVDVVAGNRFPQEWSWGLSGVPWYCSHCPMLLEQFPLETFGSVIRPTEFSPDPNDPTRWIIYK
jgi:hypothetical protein